MFLLRGSLEVNDYQQFPRTVIGQGVGRAWIVDIAQLHEYLQSAVLVPSLGDRDIDRSRIIIRSLQRAVLSGTLDLNHVGHVHLNPPADEHLEVRESNGGLQSGYSLAGGR